MRRILFTTALTILAGTGGVSACTVSLGEMAWGSAKIGTAIPAFILEQGDGCTVEVISTTTIPAITSMTETGSPDAITEVWMNTGGTALEAPFAVGTVINAGPVLSDGGVEGWWIPKAFAEAHPEIRTVEDVQTNPQLFADPESPCIGAFFNCPSGWASQTINTDLLRAYSMTEAFADVDPGLGEALTASIARASERGEGRFGYYWAPTSVLGKYPIVMFEMAAYNAGTYVCLADAACAAPASNNYRAAEVNMIYTAAFAEREPAAAAFLDSVSFTNDVMNAVLAWQEDNGADTSQATGYFAVTYPEVWQAWLTPETAANVTAALSQ